MEFFLLLLKIIFLYPITISVCFLFFSFLYIQDSLYLFKLRIPFIGSRRHFMVTVSALCPRVWVPIESSNVTRSIEILQNKHSKPYESLNILFKILSSHKISANNKLKLMLTSFSTIYMVHCRICCWYFILTSIKIPVLDNCISNFKNHTIFLS